MEILKFVIFLAVSHLLAMQIFRLTTYHAFFWKAFPLLIAYGAVVGWALYALDMHPFFLWQLVLASAWLFSVGRQQSKMAEAMLATLSDDADEVRLMAVSTAKTSSHYAYSLFVYIATFAAMFLRQRISADELAEC